MRKIALLALLPFAVLLPPAPGAATGIVKAGVGVVDATWHVGASAGQYASDHPCDVTSPDECFDAATVDRLHNYDPNFHQTRRAPSYGVQSRNSVRVIVIEGADGTRVALMKNDLYIPQDLLNERVATILEEHDRRVDLGLEAGPKTFVDHANLVSAVSHNHSSPYYSTPSWGVWAFQDVFDLRFFEYMAQRSAQAVIQAVGGMVPVRMGATTVPFSGAQRHSYGTAVADDVTPAGYPEDASVNDRTISVLRFDDITNPASPQPLAVLMTLGLHPEMLEGNNLITGDYIAPLQRLVGRATGATLVFMQNNTGTSEPDRGCRANPCSARSEYSHREYAQAERAARKIADVVLGAYASIGAGAPVPGATAFVPFSDDFPVAVADRQFAPPVSHPYPSVSNCRSHEAFDGNPGVPIIGLPDCERITDGELKPYFDMLGPLDPGVTYNTLRAAGVPLPDNYSAPSYTGLQETFQVHLQAVRLGDVLITVCPCEQWADQSMNIKTRADNVQDSASLWNGYNWPCSPSGPNWVCAHPGNSDHPGPLTITDAQYQLIRAQVNNPADGWDDLANAPYAEYEPTDPALIKGNFTHEEIQEITCGSGPCPGYAMVVPVGMANDYWGYLASYREYQRGDHYRKALTGLGPHSEDFMATRLVRMGATLQGGPEVAYNPLDLAYMVDGAHQHARALLLGHDAQVLITAYESLLPPDGGTPAALAQPASIKRFDATSFSWVGGSNYTDDPHVSIERLVGGEWKSYADQSGEVIVTLNFPETGISLEGVDPDASDLPEYLTGSFEWNWTATFEAFDSDIDTGAGNQTPAGTYRFVVDGRHRAGPLDAQAYHLESNPFTVSAWDGITVSNLSPSPTGATFDVGPRETRSYTTGYPNGGAAVSGTVGPIGYPDRYLTHGYPAEPETGDKLFPRVQRYAVDPNPPGPDGGLFLYCLPCSFRAWAQSGTVDQAAVTVTHPDLTTTTVSATCTAGSCSATVALASGDCVSVEAGQIIDTFGEINAAGTTPVCLP